MDRTSAATPILKTQRLQLDLWDEDDFQHLYDLHADPRIQVGYIPESGKWTEEGIRKLFRRYQHQQSADRITKWKMSLQDGTFVGRGGWALWQPGVIEIGYAVRPEFQGNGYAFEIAEGLISWARETRSERLIGFALLDNAASRHILQRAGMKFNGVWPLDGVPMAFYEVER